MNTSTEFYSLKYRTEIHLSEVIYSFELTWQGHGGGGSEGWDTTSPVQRVKLTERKGECLKLLYTLMGSKVCIVLGPATPSNIYKSRKGKENIPDI